MVPPSEHGNEWSRTRSHQRPRQCTIAATLFYGTRLATSLRPVKETRTQLSTPGEKLERGEGPKPLPRPHSDCLGGQGIVRRL